MIRFVQTLTRALVIASLAATVLNAAPQAARLFGDHMVLQRELPAPVWGTADPDEQITVAFAGQTLTTRADQNGHWRVTLAPLATAPEGRTLTITGSGGSVSIQDVLVGEVWFCSGQSNMEKFFGPHRGQKPVDDYKLEVAAANHPRLRLFQVPRTDLKQEGPGVFHWLPCSPEALQISDFSAAAYFFGATLQQVLGVPVGLVHSSFGGTHIEAWLPAEAFAAPPLAGLEKRSYPAWVKGVQATELYESMVKPYAPFAVRGFIWYQGETNLMEGDVALYAEKQTALIASWRKAWSLPDASFYGVLLAPMDYSRWEKFPITAGALPAFWTEQIKALSAPHTGFVVTTDLVKDVHDIHPTDKRDVGLRLARLALAGNYGRSEISAHGPTFAGMRVESNRIEITFDNAEGMRTRDGLAPAGFLISDDKQTFLPATALIENNKVVLSNDRVEKPVAVRFAWDETANPNLINAAGLPAVPFRTDDWALRFLREASADPAAAKR